MRLSARERLRNVLFTVRLFANIYQCTGPVESDGGSSPGAAAQFLFGDAPAVTFQVPP